MAKEKTMEQVRFLLSSVSPLSEKEKAKLKRELHSGAVVIKNMQAMHDKKGMAK